MNIYTPHTWQQGDIISTAALNTIENQLETDSIEINKNTELIDGVNYLVDYGYYNQNLAADINSGVYVEKISVEKNGTHIKINGELGSTFISVKITNGLSRAGATTTIKDWPAGISLIQNHRYYVSLKLISGTVSNSDSTRYPTISILTTGSASSIGTVVKDGFNVSRTFTYDQTPINIGIYIYGGTTLTNAVYELLLIDITDRNLNFPLLKSNNGELLTGLNIDNLVKPGLYTASSYSDAATVLGTPPTTTAAYKLYILEVIADRIVQLAFFNNTDTPPKYRYNNGTTWSNWKTFATTDYVDNALDQVETITDLTPSITGVANKRYICGEVSSLSITPPSTGIIDVIFESGSTATTLTVTPPTGLTMKWADNFGPSSIDANTTYEVNIMDGQYGVICAWA